MLWLPAGVRHFTRTESAAGEDVEPSAHLGVLSRALSYDAPVASAAEGIEPSVHLTIEWPGESDSDLDYPKTTAGLERCRAAHDARECRQYEPS